MARSHLLVNADTLLRFLEGFRMMPMAIVSVIAIAIALRFAKGDTDKPQSGLTGVALLSLWLGTAAAAIMDHYSFARARMLFVGLWPLRENSPWWSWFIYQSSWDPAFLCQESIQQYHYELIFLFALGAVTWVLCLVQLAAVSIRTSPKSVASSTGS